ncbi:Tryptophan halogenase [Sphingomonas sp. EC-HK361]|uniref:tryptophan halogenase family protein n=1 Tax=Sphingomonas sp. EC-HK361 TaxID=2038397 RepID=UPI0012571475|nr:tryptophan halogenase family protein [Sphingomonas sp. EC-HK361]VVT12804.1 Tryptophan halogenase [Sphingomonas sp. EC-HK361]
MTPPSVVILGGGTAGWMTACLIAKAWPDASVTLVESPEIGIVGVGEGSTPQLRHFFRTLGIDERDWMPAAHATYKVGIAFRGWSREPGYEAYFHPFASAVDLHTEPAFHAAHLARRTGRDVPAHPDRFFLNSRLAEGSLAPLPSESFPFDATYGYHFDATLVGQVLRDHAVGRGVTHLPRRVDEVVIGAEGAVTHLVLDGGETLAGDLFVDCSGFGSVIAQGALGVPFVSYADTLFNDRAVVMPTPLTDAGPRPYTTSTALSAGWAWDIPLITRTGNGYVYSSRYIDADAAEAELRANLGDTNATARHLTMKVGRVAESWKGNCLAVGLAQGFIEPLEATALHIVQATVEGFVQAFTDGGFTPKHRDTFNRTIARRYDGIRDYIFAHYRLNRRGDTEYWRDCAANDRLSDSLKRLFTCWFTGGDLLTEIAEQDIARHYAPLSWGCIFAGYGTFPDAAKLTAVPTRDDGLDDFLTRCALNFPSHAKALEALAA